MASFADALESPPDCFGEKCSDSNLYYMRDVRAQPFTLRMCAQDGGKAAQAKMEPSKQSVDTIKRVVAEARKKAGSSHSPAHGFNEEDVGGYMDGGCRVRINVEVVLVLHF